MNRSNTNFTFSKHRIFRIALIPAMLLCLGMTGFPQDANPPVSNTITLDSFSIIVERNIFNPNRKKRIIAPPVVREEEPKVDRFTLVGVMITDATSYAFFDGSEPQYQSVYQVGAQIAGCRLSGISSEGITLATGDQKIEIAVMKGMERRENEDWKLSSSSSSSYSRRGSSRSSPSSRDRLVSTTGSSAPPATTTSAPDNDILKKLMEKRNQELGK